MSDQQNDDLLPATSNRQWLMCQENFKDIKEEQTKQRDLLSEIKTKLFNGLFAKVDRIDDDAKKAAARRVVLTVVAIGATLAFIFDIVLHFIASAA